MKIRSFILILAGVATLFSCKKQTNELLASGMFEATEVVVSAQASGQIESFNITEGMKLPLNHLVGIIDTSQLYLQKLLLLKNNVANRTHLPNVKQQVAALNESLANAKVEQLRVSKLFAGDAATQKQVDDANAQVKIIQGQLDAFQNNLEININNVNAQSSVIDIQIAQVEDLLRKAYIRNPSPGVVLVKYAEQGEFATIGKPLYKIVNPDQLKLKAYFTGEQLLNLQLGQEMNVRVAYGDEERNYTGRVNWISEVAEFTPKTIQMRDERANLVYAVKLLVKNDGFLKIGMYGDVVQ